MSLYEQPSSNNASTEGPSTMSALSSALAQAHDAMLRLEKLADGISGGVPQSVPGSAAGKSSNGAPPIAAVIRDHAVSLAEIANRIHVACQRIETAF